MHDIWKRHSALDQTYVKVLTADSRIHHGHLHAIDPSSGNLALLSRGPAAHLILGHSVVSIAAAGPAPDGTPTALPRVDPPAPSIRLSRADVLAGLRRRRIEAQEEGGRISVMGGLASVGEPFGVDGCRSADERVLIRLRRMVRDIGEEAARVRGVGVGEEDVS